MNNLKGKVLVAQGGGPTAVINQSLVGVVTEARKFSHVTAVYGALHGVNGIINENFIDLEAETTNNLELVAGTPSSALLSTRDKPDAEYCERMFKTIKKHDIRYFFYIGGNDSSDTVRIVSEHAQAANYEMRAIHIPKTIDNDLAVNDHCPGYGSAARFVASAFMGVNLDNRALPGVYIGVVMGRHAGFLTAAASLARKYEDEGPHLIYLPERPVTMEKILGDIDRVVKERGLCVVAASEGIVDENHTPIITRLIGDSERDAHGNVQLSGTGALGDLLTKEIKAKLKLKRVRSDTFGYLQRSFIECVSDRDQREAREVGEVGVQLAMASDKDASVAILRPVQNYSVSYELTDLTNIAAKTRTMPDEFITAAGNGVTDAFYSYCRPLVGSRFPESHRLRAPRVPKLND
jgi:6-phosphofructokinase 1